MNKDGLEDFFIGNGYKKKGELFIQNVNGHFSSSPLETGDKRQEDTGCLFFDVDNDNDEDLLVTSGTNEFPRNSPYLLPRLYLNDGKGNFTRNTAAIPAHLTTVTTVVKASDFDKDGDLDLFLGGRIVSENYPLPAVSYLLQNNKGIFTDVTKTYCPELITAGMVTDAEWIDVDGDKMDELVITGEWMPVRIFKNQQSNFKEITAEAGLASFSGMWRSVAASDLDKDGDVDLVVGNIGLNNKYHFNSNHPLNLWYADIDGNGSIDPIMGYYMAPQNGKKDLYTALNLDDIAGQVPAIKKQYLLHKDFSTATMAAVFKTASNPVKLLAAEAASCWFENTGKGVFKKHQLPAEAHVAPLNCILINDYNNDRYPDVLIAGNEYQSDITTGQYDASYGLLLLGNAKKRFTPVTQAKSGFFLRGDARCMRQIIINKKPMVLAAVNNTKLQVYKIGD